MARLLRAAAISGCAIVVLTAALAAFADDLAVPSQYKSIARAMSAAKSGDRVVVTGGEWRNPRIVKAGISVVAVEAEHQVLLHCQPREHRSVLGDHDALGVRAVALHAVDLNRTPILSLKADDDVHQRRLPAA